MPKRKLVRHRERLAYVRHVATLPCQSGNLERPARRPQQRGCNFTMPKRKPMWISHSKVDTSSLQLYHAKAETIPRIEASPPTIAVATLPCQSGNRCVDVNHGVSSVCCNFTMPKRKLFSVPNFVITLSKVATLPCQSGNLASRHRVFLCFSKLQLYHAKAETAGTLSQMHRNHSCCNFTMPKRKRQSAQCGRQPMRALQLYHAKAETAPYQNLH